VTTTAQKAHLPAGLILRRWPAVTRVRNLLRSSSGRWGFVLTALLVAIAVVGPFLAPGSVSEQDLSQALLPPAAGHWLGTDQLGRDIAFRLVLALRRSWAIVAAGTVSALVAGALVGIAAGYRRGVLEPAMLRFLDLLLAVPNFVLALVIAALLGAGTEAVTIALFARAFPVFARVAHVSTRKLMTQEFVQSAVVLGARPARVLTWYVVPNVFTPCITLLPVLLGGGLLIAASLSFFGLGVQPPEVELGLLVAEGRRYMHLAPMLLWAPGILLTVNNIGLALLGKGIREVLDPMQREVVEGSGSEAG
jgi:peptide/nickel transport system permease protein